MNEEWRDSMIQQMIDKKGLSEIEAKEAVRLYESEYIGQNSHALWQWAIRKAKGNSNG